MRACTSEAVRTTTVSWPDKAGPEWVVVVVFEPCFWGFSFFALFFRRGCGGRAALRFWLAAFGTDFFDELLRDLFATMARRWPRIDCGSKDEMPDTAHIPVLEVHAIAARQAFVVLDVAGTPLASSHTAPGQYVKAGFFDDDVARPLALCNKPGTGTFELLLKVPDVRRTQLLGMQKGDRVDVGLAQGKGFPIEQARGGDLWLFGVGSGIGPLKAVLDVVLEDRTAFRDVVVVYGVREANELAFRDRFGTWVGHSVSVIPVVSRPATRASWDGKTGHVQHQLPRSFDKPAQVTAFVCGLPEMEKAVCEQLLERGVGPDQVFRNW